MDYKNLNILQENQLNFILEETKQRNERIKPIKDHLKNYSVIEVSEVNDYQIAKIKRKSGDTKEIMYSTFLHYKPLNNFGMTMDEAILICLAHKYEGRNSDFPIYAERMLNTNFSIETEDE